jgi:hypothetical protein
MKQKTDDVKNIKSLSRASRKGQSLIEVIVAITVLTVGFLGISSLLSRSLALNRVTANEVTATYLAAEGVEIAKNLIDHDVYGESSGQTAGWGACFGNGGDFELDYTTADCRTLASFAGDPLWYHAGTHLYDYSANGGTATSFTRMIRVATNGDEITVTAEVLWTGFGGSPGSINLEDHFYKWY